MANIQFEMIKQPVPSGNRLFLRLAVQQQDARRGGVGADEFERSGDHEIAAFGDVFQPQPFDDDDTGAKQRFMGRVAFLRSLNAKGVDADAADPFVG